VVRPLKRLIPSRYLRAAAQRDQVKADTRISDNVGSGQSTGLGSIARVAHSESGRNTLPRKEINK